MESQVFWNATFSKHGRIQTFGSHPVVQRLKIPFVTTPLAERPIFYQLPWKVTFLHENESFLMVAVRFAKTLMIQGSMISTAGAVWLGSAVTGSFTATAFIATFMDIANWITHSLLQALPGRMTMSTLTPPADDEIVVAKPKSNSLMNFVSGRVDFLARELQDRLQKEARPTAAGFSLSGIRFIHRLNYGRKTLTFKKADLASVAHLMGWTLKIGPSIPKVIANDVITSGAGLAKVFEVKRQRLNAEFRNWMDGRLDVIRAKITIDGIEFNRKLGNDGKEVWTFSKRQVRTVGKLRGWPLRTLDVEAMQPGDVALSEGGLDAEKVIGNTNDRARALAKELNQLRKSNEPSVNYEGIIFSRKKNGPHEVWTFKRKHLSRVAKLRGWELEQEQPLGNDSIALSELVQYFYGNKSEVISRVTAAMGLRNFKGAGATSRGIEFVKGRRSGNPVWYVRKQDLALLAAAVPLSPRVDLKFATSGPTIPSSAGTLDTFNPEDQLAIEEDGFEGLVFDFPAVVKRLQGYLSLAQGRSITIKGIPFTLRERTDGSAVWTIARSDLAKLIEELKLIAAIDFTREVAATRWSLDGLFVEPRDAAKSISSALDSKSKNTHTIYFKGVRYTQRMLPDGSLAWAFEIENKDLVAKTFDSVLDENPADLIARLGLEDAVALLGKNPILLRQFLELCHPELFSGHADGILTMASLRGLRAVNTAGPESHPDDHTWPKTLARPELSLVEPAAPNASADLETSGHSFRIKGQVAPGTEEIRVTGSYRMVIRPKADGSFSAAIPLPVSAGMNFFGFYCVDKKVKQKSESTEFTVLQTDEEVPETEESFRKLLSGRQEVLEDVRRKPERFNFLLHSVEQSLLRHFTYGEDRGFAYMVDLIEHEQSPYMKEVYKAVDREFRMVVKEPFKVKRGENPYFFQKYTAYRAERLLNQVDPLTKEKSRCVIIGNHAGTGKTLVGLLLINGQEALIITPNAVVSTWVEESRRFMRHSHLTPLEGKYSERDALLQNIISRQVVVNVEYMQKLEAHPSRLAGLGRFASRTIVDEGHFLGRSGSEQSRGTARLVQSFAERVYLMTATPVKKLANLRSLLAFMFPGYKPFRSPAAFQKAFNAKHRDALKALHLLLNRHMVRIKMDDVFETFDPDLPLESQPDRLPAKNYDHPDALVSFELLSEQCDSIFGLFTDYAVWCAARLSAVKKHKVFVTAKDKRFLREGFFSKLHAWRQIMNNPEYFGSKRESPKHQAMDKIIDLEMTRQDDPTSKVLIFCEYVEQAKVYVERYARYGAIAYHGEIPRDSNGYKIDSKGKLEYYAVDDEGKFILRMGRPVLSSLRNGGTPIRALDCSAILFQNDPDSRILVATYDAGSVGVTFTAAHAIVHDDLAGSYGDQYQADGRAPRIDNARRKYEVRYYRLQARYPLSFLKALRSRLSALPLTPKERQKVLEFFRNGTFDQVQSENLRIQEQLFNLLMDWIGDEDDMQEIQDRFLKNRLPLLFEQTKASEIRDELGVSALVPNELEGSPSISDSVKKVEEMPPANGDSWDPPRGLNEGMAFVVRTMLPSLLTGGLAATLAILLGVPDSIGHLFSAALALGTHFALHGQVSTTRKIEAAA